MKKDSNVESGENNKQQNDNANRECDSKGEEPQLAPTMMRVCEFCGKKFRSGKALGGHKRFHLQAQKKEKELLANKPNNNDEKLICYLCNKEFQSEKSLFGHMRSHPHRDWKGIQPPNTPIIDNNDSSSSSSNDGNNNNCVIDVSKFLPLPSWGKRDTRGRESVLTSAIRTLASMIDELSDDKGAIMEKEEERSRSKKRKLIVRFDGNNNDEEENLETLLDGYKCNICDKSFPTFQGLRRHRSRSHNNKDNRYKSSSSSSMNDDDEKQRRTRPLINIKKESDEEEANNNSSKDPAPKFDLNELPNDDKDEKK